MTCSVLVFTCILCRAQEIRHYRITFEAPLSTAQEKQLMAAFSGLDTYTEFEIDRATAQVDLKTSRSLDRIRLSSNLAAGPVITSFIVVNGGSTGVPTRTPRVQRMADMPIYIDTGDPSRDNARYDAYKAAWVATHPEQYHELTTPVAP